MRQISTALGCLMMTALSAFALDQSFVDSAMQSARNIERDAALVGAAVKSKHVDADDVRKKVDAMSADIAALHKLVADFEAANPQMSERDRADWKVVTDMVKLLEIFHGQKQKLVSEDLARNRSLIRAHANGVAWRADKLQQTLAKIGRAPLT